MNTPHHSMRLILVLTAAFWTAGCCLSEQSFTVRDEQLLPPPVTVEQAALPMRAWTEETIPALRAYLEPDEPSPITCAAMQRADGSEIDVYQLYRLNARLLDSFIGNARGIQETAQVSPPGDEPRRSEWPGYASVQIPMSDGMQLCARLAPPRGRDAGGSYVVETHGLFAAQEGHEAHNISEALRRQGHHVLAIEMRGHGETGRLNPGFPMTFGASEVRDLLEVARWLRQAHGARRVVLLSYSITAQQAMTAAWVDATAFDPRETAKSARSPIMLGLPAPAAQQAYDGIIAVCPPTNLLEYADSLERRYLIIESPVRATFQQRIAERLRAQGERATHSMWKFVRHELRRSEWAGRYADDDAMIADVVQFIDFSGDDWEVGRRRLERVRTPLLIIATANDPLGSAQSTVRLVSRVRNPNVALVVVGRGGHTGLSAANAPYYHSVLAAFFNPETCPRSQAIAAVALGEE